MSIKIICEYTSAENYIVYWDEKQFDHIADASHNRKS
jgi:hypothetical protein